MSPLSDAEGRQLADEFRRFLEELVSYRKVLDKKHTRLDLTASQNAIQFAYGTMRDRLEALGMGLDVESFRSALNPRHGREGGPDVRSSVDRAMAEAMQVLGRLATRYESERFGAVGRAWRSWGRPLALALVGFAAGLGLGLFYASIGGFARNAYTTWSPGRKLVFAILASAFVVCSSFFVNLLTHEGWDGLKRNRLRSILLAALALASAIAAAVLAL